MKALASLLVATLLATAPAVTALAQTRGDAPQVTVTLVRWPYT
jgi:hypothetical protein